VPNDHFQGRGRGKKGRVKSLVDLSHQPESVGPYRNGNEVVLGRNLGSGAETSPEVIKKGKNKKNVFSFSRKCDA